MAQETEEPRPGAAQARWYRPYWAALATAALVVLAGPGVSSSGGLSLLAWVAVAPLLVAIRHRPVKAAFKLGLLAGVAVNLGLCPWFPGLLARFAGLHPALAVLAALAIAVYQGLGWAVWAAVVRAGSRALPTALLAPAAMVVSERWLPMVFPYSLGLTQYRTLPVIQIAELGGPYAVTFLMVMVGAAVAAAIAAYREGRPRPWRLLAVVGGVLVAALIYGELRRARIASQRDRAPALRVGLVQAGVVHAGWQPPAPDDAALLARYQLLSAELERRHGVPDLLLWPEKAYPLLLRHDAAYDYPPGHRRRIRRGFESPLVYGLTSVDAETRQIYNSAAFVDRDGRQRVFYDKVRLIFYSEWLPRWAEGWDGRRRYEPGTRLEPLLLPVPARPAGSAARQVSIGTLICFEAVFPGHVRELLKHRPELLVNLSDDAWFGDTIQPEQHLAHAVLRAVEARRDLVRPTGSGISAFIAATGEIYRRSELSRSAAEPQLMVAPVRLLRGPSLYRSLGDLCCICCVAVVFVAGACRLTARARKA